jgi:tripartite-type tricarboxylate transporter receptor subunit TctC
MHHSRRRIIKSAVKSALALPFISTLPRIGFGQADDYPSHEIHSICMFPAGTGADVIVRYYSRKLQEVAGKPVIVENRIGAAGNIATEYVARSKPDGYTIFIAPASSIIPTARLIFKNLNYDPEKDLQSVALLATVPFILFVAGNTPIKSVADLVADLKKKGEQGTYGSSTTIGQVCGEMFKAQFGLKTTEVKYRSGLDGLNELTKNQLDFYFSDPGTTKGMVADGRLRPLMLTLKKRSSVLDVPSAPECGVMNLDLDSFWSAHVPAGTPAPIVNKLKGWLDTFSDSEETKKFLSDYAGAETLQGGPKEVDERMASDHVKWVEYVRVAKIEPQ